MQHTNAFLRDRSRPKWMQQTGQSEFIPSVLKSQDHTQGRILKHTCKNTYSACFVTWMCSGLRHSRAGMSHKPGTTHTPQHSCTLKAEAEPAHCSVLQDKHQFPGCGHSSFPTLTPPAIPQPGRTQALCCRPLCPMITLQFVPSEAAKSTQLKNASQSYRERIWHSRTRQQPVCLAVTHCISVHLFLFCAGWQRSALSYKFAFYITMLVILL